jgi:F-type H+-transporting ATPase subunit a
MEASTLVQEVIEYQKANFLGYQVHIDTIVISWMIIIFYLVFALVMRTRYRVVPGYAQTILEMLVGGFDSLSCSMIGEKKGKRYVPYIVSIFLFIVSCNLLGLLPPFCKIGHFQISMPPTRDISTTVALALISFLAFQYYGYRQKGIKYVLHYIYPIPMLLKAMTGFMKILIIPLFFLFLFLNIMEECARVLSLSVRLMGNILGEHIVASALILFFTVVLKMSIFLCPLADILPLFVLFLGLLTGVIQAFIFSVLTLSYIAHAVEEEH